MTDLAKLRELANAAPLSIERECVDPGPQGNDFYQVTAACDEFYEAARSAVPALLDRCEAAEAVIAKFLPHPNGPDATTEGDPEIWNAAMENLGTQHRALQVLTTDRDRLAAECERLRALVGEACGVASIANEEVKSNIIRADIERIRAEAKGEV